MRSIIAPAKKMNPDLDSFPTDALPQFTDRTERLMFALQAMSPKELQTLWKCNDTIARLNVERLPDMDLRRRLTPAVLADQLAVETDLVLNLSSKEYSRAVEPHLPPAVRFLTCTFGELKDDKVVEKGIMCKMARGRWCAGWRRTTSLTQRI